MTGQHRLSAAAIDAALAKSALATLPPTLCDTLTQDALAVDLPAGTTLYYEADQPRCGLVLAGLLRVYMTAPDGRQITVRYARAGDLLGIATAVGGPAPVNVQILTDAALLTLNVRTLHGTRRFTMRWSQTQVQDFGETGKVLLDLDDNRYLVPDVEALPPKEQELFLRYVYW